MAYEEKLCTVSFPAGGDLSAAQYHFMRLVNSSGRAVLELATQNDRVIGVLQNDPPAAGVPGTVGIGGVTKVVAGAAITAGQAVTTDSQGRAIPVHSTADFELGIATISVSNAGEIVSVLMQTVGIS